MAKLASIAGPKWQEKTGSAGQGYVAGAQATDKDQAQRAIAAIPLMQAGLLEAFAKGRVQKGLAHSGKAGWLRGIVEKGAANFLTGVSTPTSLSLYTTNSGKFDSARMSSASMPRGPRGSAQNLAKVATVVNALRAAKLA